MKARGGVVISRNWRCRAGELDIVMLGKALLENPHWAYAAAKKLGRPKPQDTLPVQYAVWLKGR